MDNNSKFSDTVEANAGKILEAVKAGENNSWELKIKLHLSSSALYLALGWLVSRGQVELFPQELNFRVKAI